MRIKPIIILAALLITMSTQAQRRRQQVKKPVVEEPTEDPRITQMLSSVQKVVFIDSMVVDADNYMSHIPLSPYAGTLAQNGTWGTYTNEMGDRRLTTVSSGTTTTIAGSDLIAGTWSEPQPLIENGEADAANPFLMPDGITLYFAQKGEKSIGGYDIFVTRYNSDRGTFLKPENAGMPFASEANDLFYAVDEFNRLGYFVTDRRQPQGKVCIYVFIPEQTRHAYRSEAYSDQQIRSLAVISSIADTWSGATDERDDALTRLAKARSAKNTATAILPRNRQMSELDDMRHQADVLQKSLDKARKYYATAPEDERQLLRSEILKSEQQLEQLQTEIRNKERSIPYDNGQ